MSIERIINNSFPDCGIDSSSFMQYDGFLRPHEIAIKYVVSGTEMYELDGRKHIVNTAQYLVTNSLPSTRCVIDSTEPVEGTCIALSSDLIRQSAAFMAADEISSLQVMRFLKSQDYFYHVYNAGNSRLGHRLYTIGKQINDHTLSSTLASAECLFQLTDAFFLDQFAHFRNLSDIQAVKAVTRNDLYSRLLIAKYHIQENPGADISMEMLADIAHLSLYHFYRLFKAAFQCSPYQYVQQQRIMLAKQLLKDGFSATETAQKAGFSDVFTFSKAFKRNVGVSPRDYQQ